MKISVIGLGKLGMEIFNVLSEHYEVKGIDKTFPVNSNGNTDYSNLGEIAFIVVPTNSLPNYKFSSEDVEDVLKKIEGKQAVSIVSTLMPGETDRLQKLYPNLNLIYNPAFVALGSVTHDFTYPDMVLIGGKNYQVLLDIYKKIVKTKPFYATLTPLEAEVTKLTLNCYITTKITFANQIGNLCHRIGISPNRILEAVGHDTRIGNKYFKSGLGYGGPCFPRDNLAMSAYMLDNSIYPYLTQTIHSLNEQQVDEIVNRILSKKPKTIGFKGLSYKEGSEVMDESQLLKIYNILKNKGYDVRLGKGDVMLDWDGIK